MSARDEIFANIRRSLHVSGAEAPRRAAVADRLAKSPLGLIPARGQGGIATFKAEAERAAATLEEVASAADIPQAIAGYLRAHNLPATLRIGADPRLTALPWERTPLEVSHGASDGHDLNAASVAFAAIAETGTLALASGADNPTTLNFLPDNHVVVVFAQDVVGDLETVFARLRARYGAGQAPRTLNFITGPSRSADIEQTLLFGAHGPRRLHILLVKSVESIEAVA
jgi:L-lactate dehydrogenase complex protein LldG